MKSKIKTRGPRVDLTGRRYGDWEVLGYDGRFISRSKWNCRCICGTLKSVVGADLKNGASTRCRACYARAQRCNDDGMIGEIYGVYSVLRVIKEIGVPKQIECKCINCGSLSLLGMQAVKGRRPKYCKHCPTQECKRGIKGSKAWNWAGYGSIPGWYWGRLSEKSNRNKHPVTITIVDADVRLQSQKEKCALTGIPIQFGSISRTSTASLDRIDSSKGYIPGNIQWVHKTVNRMKSDFSQEDFIAMCRLVAEQSLK